MVVYGSWEYVGHHGKAWRRGLVWSVVYREHDHVAMAIMIRKGRFFEVPLKDVSRISRNVDTDSHGKFK